jgi:hypothetical protein
MAFTIDRTTVLRAPARLTYGGGTFQAKGDIVITPVIPRSSISTAMHGMLDSSRATDRMFRITFTPAGTFDNLSVLFAALTANLGTSLIGDTDKPLVINTRVGTLKLTFVNVAITKLPTLTLSTSETIFGEVECMAIIGKNLSPHLSSSYYVATTEAYPGDTGFDPDNILTLAYQTAWGGIAPWDSFETRGGWVITPNITVEPETANALGTFDYKLTDVEVTAVAQPLGVTHTDVLGKMGLSGHLGKSRLPDGDNLNISATGVYIRVNNALIDSGPTTFGTSPLVGEVTWKATRTFTDGVPDPLLIVATEDPDA